MEEDRLRDLLKIGEEAVVYALRAGVDEAEAYLSRACSTFVNIERGQVVRNARLMDEGLGIRVAHEKSVGFSYTNILEKDAVEKTVTRAYRTAKAGNPDKNWSGFPAPRSLPFTRNTYDKELVDMAVSEVVDVAARMLEAATNFDRRVKPVEGVVAVWVLSKVAVNSHGVNVYDVGTGVHCLLGTMAKEGDNVTPLCFEFDSQRLRKVEPERVGSDVARLAVSALPAKNFETGNYTVILSQLALWELLYYTLISALKADHVQRGRSALKGKIGGKVASELFSVYDDGLLEGGLATWRFDDEGTPRQKTAVIERGVLKHYLYDNYTAGKDNVKSTGNAYRTPPVPYSSTPAVEATNFTVEPSSWFPEKLIGETDRGLLIHSVQGAHSSNPESGEFSVVATPAWKVEGGEVKHPVKGVMLSGTVYDTLKGVSGVGNNVRKIGFLVAPWIRVDGMRVVGR